MQKKTIHELKQKYKNKTKPIKESFWPITTNQKKPIKTQSKYI